LEQDKLDAIAKRRSNLFNWRGQFTPEFVEYILTSFAKEGDHILDPFSGSGTVLLESARLGLKATGFEINPSAHAMSQFFTLCNLTNDERNDFCTSFEQKLNTQLLSLNEQRIFVDTGDYRQSYRNLLDFAESFDHYIDSKQERIFFMNILFQSEKDKKLSVAESISKSLQYIKKSFLELPHSVNTIEAHLLDARSSGDKLANTVDFILTSPPYINVFNYHQNYRAIIETFHFNILKVAHSEFGSNRKNRGNRFKTVIQYCIDMELAIRSFWKALKPNSRMVLVVGRESNVRGTPFYNGQLVAEIIKKTNGFSEMKTLERQFTNKFGASIKEDIIVATKTGDLSDSSNGRAIAASHLKHNLKTSKNSVHADLSEAILNSEAVKESPIFDPKQIMEIIRDE
jgi:DNA modification methylase